MKKLILLLAILSIALAGHIYVIDPYIEYQNTGYFKKATLFFSLESGLVKGGVVRVTWPFDWTVSGGKVAEWTATTLVAGTVSNPSTNIIAFVTPSALASNVWYQLELSSGTAATTSNQLYTKPIQIETVS